MKSAILINGITLPHHVIDTAIQWAVANRESLKAVFIYQSNSKLPYHGWPRDKAITRFMSGELYAEGNLIDLIDRHVKYTISCCALSAIVCEIVVAKNPGLSDVVGQIGLVEKIFADQDTFTRPEDFAYTSITPVDLEVVYGEKLSWCNRNHSAKPKKVSVVKVA